MRTLELNIALGCTNSYKITCKLGSNDYAILATQLMYIELTQECVIGLIQLKIQCIELSNKLCIFHIGLFNLNNLYYYKLTHHWVTQ